MNLAGRLAGAVTSLTVRLRGELYAAGLSLTQARVLVTLRDHGPQRVTDLATRELVAQPSMTSLVNRMQRQGLVTREADPADGRAVLVRPTAAGMELLVRVSAAREAALARLLDGLDEHDHERLAAALPVLERLAARDPRETEHATR